MEIPSARPRLVSRSQLAPHPTFPRAFWVPPTTTTVEFTRRHCQSISAHVFSSESDVMIGALGWVGLIPGVFFSEWFSFDGMLHQTLGSVDYTSGHCRSIKSLLSQLVPIHTIHLLARAEQVCREVLFWEIYFVGPGMYSSIPFSWDITI